VNVGEMPINIQMNMPGASVPVGDNPKIQETQSQGSEQSQQTIAAVMQKMKIEPEYIPNIQEKTLISAIEKANQRLVGSNRQLQLSVHEKTKTIMAKIVDTNTKEVIKEIPSEKMLDMVYSMLENAGLIVDEKR
jgi:flagellar protein FlaG